MPFPVFLILSFLFVVTLCALGATYVRMLKVKAAQVAAAAETQHLRETSDTLRAQLQPLQEERTQLIARNEVLAAETERLKADLRDSENRHAKEREEQRARHAAQVEELRKQMAQEREYAAQLTEQNNRQWAQKFETLKEEMQRTAAELLAAKQAALQEQNRTQMGQLLQPIKEQFAEFKKSVEESRTAGELHKQGIQDSFEAAMKLFRQEQQQTVSALREQTQRIGTDAANLTKALKGDSKMQGDWGEMVLETMLENSGLRKNEEYFIQENTQDEAGHNFRPDVVVRFPEGRAVVIDSKVSLTAYADAVAVEDDSERERLMKEHVKSLRKHVDELEEKNYTGLVDKAMGFVLMFVPNESSYIAAMRRQPDLIRYAWQKHILIISPSNLLMALQLAYHLWQYDRQNKNVEKIVKAAADLYDKVAGFADTFADVETQIGRLSASFEKAKKQLYEGTGNVMKRVETLKSLGVTPRKQIKAMAKDE